MSKANVRLVGTRWIVALFTALLFAASFSMVGCKGTWPARPVLPPPSNSTSVGPGDTLEIVVFEETWPKEYRVQADGTIDFPNVGTITVGGLEPIQINHLIRQKLEEGKIRYNAIINTTLKNYASKKVSLIGQVQKPGSFPWTEGLKLVDVIVQAGGFNSIADSNHVKLTRQIGDGKSITVEVSVDAITDGAYADILLQTGDTIKVDARVF
ncbi:MAG: polysaccharide export protein [Polyangiaceae bacterium]|nr:polysaccharide export protein [Polyangiaceae bacterium]